MSQITASKPKPFKIDIPESEWKRAKQLAELTDLKPYLSKLVEEADESQSDHTFANEFGIKSSRLVDLVDRLKGGFDWYKWQTILNDMGQHFMTTVAGIEDEPSLEVHFIYSKCQNPNAPHILLVHGWPGSVLEFYKVAPLLKDYNLVIPSIPGYTFSSAPKAGHKFTLIKAAQALDACILSLGIDKYVAQGGDWGYFLVQNLASLFPNRCKGIHMNMAVGTLLQPNPPPQDSLERFNIFAKRGTAYQSMHIQCPYTCGAMLASSPVAVLAYIGEKFYRWSADDSHPEKDEIIANCLMYFLTGSCTSSMWLYYTFQGQGKGFLTDPIHVPAAFGGGPDDICYTNEKDFSITYKNIVHFKFLKGAGHFAALERPELLAQDFLDFLNSKQVQDNLAK